MEGAENLPAIIVPGPELRERVENFAARLSALDKRKAEEMVAKVLASSKRRQFLFVESSHLFYPFFLQRLAEYRSHPELRPQKGSAKPQASEATAETSGAATSTSNNAPSTTTTVGGVVRTVGGTAGAAGDPKRAELLRQVEQEARRYLEDPHPSRYALDLKGGSVDVPAVVMGMLTCTAQYAAKYGDPFLVAVQSRQRHNPAFRFLHAEDIRHDVFRQLVESYKRILHSTPEETEGRLESLQSTTYVLDTVCKEKAQYAKAAMARRKAALLTDDELRRQLHWSSFQVVASFTLHDLLLDGPVPQTALSRRHAATATTGGASEATATDTNTAASASSAVVRPPGAPAPATPFFMSSNLVNPSRATADPTAIGTEAPNANPPHGTQHSATRNTFLMPPSSLAGGEGGVAGRKHGREA